MNVSPDDAGGVKLGDTMAGTYPASAPISGFDPVLEAVPASGYRFDGWSGDIDSDDNPLALVMDCSKTIVANFSPVTAALTIEVEGGGSTEPAEGVHDYARGTEIELSASPDKGWRFAGWAGEVADSTAPATTVTLGSDRTVAASFSRIAHDVTIEVEGGGSTEPAAGVHDWAQGSVVDIVAVPDSGWRFAGWAGPVADPHSAATTLTVGADATVAAVFERSSPAWWVAGGGVAALAVGAVLAWLARRRRRT